MKTATRLLIVTFVLSICFVAGLYGQGQDFSAIEIKTTKLADNFYTLEGSGGMIGVLAGPDGVFMVDAQYAQLTDKIVAAIRKITPSPIRFLVNTHVHGDHTDGDTLVRFVKADILMTGDYFRSIGYPNIDRASGGTLNGMLEGLAQTIALCGPQTKVIPGHGAIVDRVGLTAHRDLILALRDKVAPLVRQGRTLEQVVASKPTAEFDSKVPGVGTTGDRFIGQLFAELQASK